jgi:hypothetical protein
LKWPQHFLPFAWILSLPMWVADVDGLACFLHRPTVYRYQLWVQCTLTGAALSRHALGVSDTFSGGVRPTGLDIYHRVDH